MLVVVSGHVRGPQARIFCQQAAEQQSLLNAHLDPRAALTALAHPPSFPSFSVIVGTPLHHYLAIDNPTPQDSMNLDHANLLVRALRPLVLNFQVPVSEDRSLLAEAKVKAAACPWTRYASISIAQGEPIGEHDSGTYGTLATMWSICAGERKWEPGIIHHASTLADPNRLFHRIKGLGGKEYRSWYCAVNAQ